MNNISLTNCYVVIKGLVSEQGKPNNGKVCFVVGADPASAERLRVLLLTSPGDYVSVRSENLLNIFDVIIRPSNLGATAGNGLFATKKILKNEIVLVDIPWLLVEGCEKPEIENEDMIQIFKRLSIPPIPPLVEKNGMIESYVNAFTTMHDPNRVQHAVKKLSEAERSVLRCLTTKGSEEFNSLSCSDDIKRKTSRDMFPFLEWWCRFEMNSLDIDGRVSGLYPLVSRINHCCTSGFVQPHRNAGSKPLHALGANVWWQLCKAESCRTIFPTVERSSKGSPLDSMCYVVTASRDIEEGEELFCDYTNLNKPSSEWHLATLGYYGIQSCNHAASAGQAGFECQQCNPSSSYWSYRAVFDDLVEFNKVVLNRIPRNPNERVNTTSEGCTKEICDVGMSKITSTQNALNNCTPEELRARLNLPFLSTRNALLRNLLAYKASSFNVGLEEIESFAAEVRRANDELLAVNRNICGLNVDHPVFVEQLVAHDRSNALIADHLGLAKKLRSP